jgi:hypothetical protein
MRVFAALLAALVLGGCSFGGDEEEPKRSRAPEPVPKAKPGEPKEAKSIREWSAALNAGKYDEAAAYFAPNAVVEQTAEVRLRDRAAAIAFNKSLPCRADVTDVDDEGRTIIAAFRLRDGPGGRCQGGRARVRFRFKDGKFSEWRQLTEPAPPPGSVA